jgi:hypothetical protein
MINGESLPLGVWVIFFVRVYLYVFFFFFFLETHTGREEERHARVKKVC